MSGVQQQDRNLLNLDGNCRCEAGLLANRQLSVLFFTVQKLPLIKP